MSATPSERHGPIPSAGQVVGGRFEVQAFVGEDALGALVRARDQKTGKPVALRLFRPGVIDAAAERALREDGRKAATLSHPAVMATYGVGTDTALGAYVAREWVDGAPLAELAQSRAWSLVEALSIAGAVGSALEAAHARGMFHGAVRPSAVLLRSDGQAKLADLAVGRAVLAARDGARAFGAEEAFLAPEVRRGAAPTAASDVFGLGMLIRALLTRADAPDGRHPETSPAIAALLEDATAEDEASRIATVGELAVALRNLTSRASSKPAAALDIDIDIPESVPPGRDAVPAGASAMRARPPGTPAAGTPAAGSPPVGGATKGEPPVARPGPPASGATAPAGERASAVDLAALVSKITENDAPRWMVVKNNLDHGPFSGRELVELIVKGDILADHGLLNMDTGKRRRVGEVPELGEFLAQYQLRKRDQDEKVAVARLEKRERVGNVAKIAIGLAVFVGIAVIVGGIVAILRQREAKDDAGREGELADLYERGQIEVSGTAGILPDVPAGSGRGRRARRAGGGGAGGAGGLSYEDAMNEAVSLGDATQGGSERRLSPGDVAGVMNRHVNSLFGCVGAELRRGGHLGNVQIDLAIMGDGRVQGASVRQGSAEFQSCIAGKVRAVRFPTFGAPRMGARYSFAVD